MGDKEEKNQLGVPTILSGKRELAPFSNFSPFQLYLTLLGYSTSFQLIYPYAKRIQHSHVNPRFIDGQLTRDVVLISNNIHERPLKDEDEKLRDKINELQKKKDQVALDKIFEVFHERRYIPTVRFQEAGLSFSASA